MKHRGPRLPGPRQPGPLPRGVKSAPEEFVIVYPPTEDGHLTEEMKKWPLVSEERPRDPSQAVPPVPAVEPKPSA